MKKLKRLLTRVWDRLYLERCECGGIIWPWQARGYDPEVGMIHLECGDLDYSGEYVFFHDFDCTHDPCVCDGRRSSDSRRNG